MKLDEAIEIVKVIKAKLPFMEEWVPMSATEALTVILEAARRVIYLEGLVEINPSEAGVAVMPNDEKLRETIEDFLNTLEESGEYDYCIKDILAYLKSFPHVVLPDPEMGARRYDEIYQRLFCEKIRSGWAGSPESLQVMIQEVKTETMHRFLAELLSAASIVCRNLITRPYVNITELERNAINIITAAVPAPPATEERQFIAGNELWPEKDVDQL